MYLRKNPRTLLASLTMAAALYGSALGLPNDGQVTNGQVNIGNPVNGQMTIQQLSDRAIINWNGFSINANEALRFIQPSQLSAILNRVTGQDPSVILGSLQANGRVFLINPNGILFGSGAQVNVGSLMASTLDITDQNFLAGRYKFDQVEGKPAASIVNEGSLTVTPGGFLVLTSPLISNQGIIVANVGQVALAAGEHTEINFDGQGLVNIQVDPTTAQAGPVAISHGMLDHMVGSLLNLAPADAITQLPDGGVEIAGASGRLHNTGAIHADALPGQAAGRVVLNSQQSTLVRTGSLITANGIGDGSDGGDVLVLSNGLAALEQGASLQSKGGSTGNGGFVELSGKDRVWVEGDVDVSAIQGTAGVFLIDPADLTIINGVNTSGTLDGFADTTGQNAPPNTVSNGFINSFNAGTLILQADNSITQNAGAAISNTNANTNLILTTNTGDINLNASIAITGTNGQLNVNSGRNIGLSGVSTFQATDSVTMVATNGGSIANAGSTALISAPTVNLTAPGGIFGSTVTPPNISSGTPLRTNATSLNLNAGPTGNIFVANQASAVVNATGGGVALGLINPGTVVVGDSGIAGSVLGTAVNATDIHGSATAGTLGNANTPTLLTVTGAIGTTAQRVNTAGSQINLIADSGLFINNTGPSVVNLRVPNGPVNITGNGNLSLGNNTFTDPLSGTPVTFATSAANPFNITLTTGSIAYADPAASHGTITGSSVDLSATSVGASQPIETGTTQLNVTATGGSLRVNNNQGATVNAVATGGAATVNLNGNIGVGTSGISGTTGTNLTTTGSLTGTQVVGNTGTTTINAGSIGTVGGPLHTAGTVVNVTATGGNIEMEQTSAAAVNATTTTGSVNLTGVGNNDVTVGSTGISGSTGTTINISGTGNLIGSATGTVGSAGTTTSITARNIGATGDRVRTTGSNVNLAADGGTVRVQNTGLSTFSVPTAATNLDILSDNTIRLAVGLDSPTTLSLVTTGGTIDFATTPFPLTANTLTLGTSADLGSSGTPFQTAAGTLNASSSGGSVFVNNTGAVTAGGNALQSYVLTATGPITLSTLTAGGAGDSNLPGRLARQRSRHQPAGGLRHPDLERRLDRLLSRESLEYFGPNTEPECSQRHLHQPER